MLKHLLCCLLLAHSCALFSQNYFTDIAEKNIPTKDKAVRHIVPREYRTVRLDLAQLQPLLAGAPERFKPGAGPEQDVVLVLPMPDGTWERFRIAESPVMAPALQAKYPEIRCYTGTGIDDPTASLKCDLTPQGFHAMIRSARRGTIFMDPYQQGDREHSIVYHKQDLDPKEPFTCSLDPENTLPETIKNDAPELVGDCTFRRYRLALACTGEYAIFHGGTKPLVLAAMNTTMNRVNGVYERDLAVSMQIITNNDTLIFLDPVTDGYSNGNGSTMLGQNQTKCNTLIGSANYDIGHVFSTGGGGVAGLGVVCNNNSKARGVTGRNAPIGDPFDIDYVAHEMGHQFNANHTQNNSCGRNPATAMEPGSASTIMGYAGICNPNVQANSDPYFHAINLQEMANFITNGNGNVCPVKTVTGNNAPTVDAGANYIIPRSTPFALTATGADPDDDPLTYCWEQMNNQTATMPPLPTNTVGPMFRSFNPTPSPTRIFPRLQDIINNINPTWERLPSVGRTLNFRVTVRDNNPDGGCTAEDNVTLTVDSTTGPFVVTVPNTAVTWYVGDTQTVTWNVAGTDAGLVNCSHVRILLSTDGGFTYPIVLADIVPNTGSADVVVPSELSTTCRVQVQAVGNIFFDISNQNFRIQLPPVPTFFLNLTTSTDVQLCSGETLSFTANTIQNDGYMEPVQLTIEGAPANATVSISQNPLLPGESADIEIGNLDQPGTYSITVTAESDTIVRVQTIALVVVQDKPDVPDLLTPANGELNTTLAPVLTWSPIPNALQYQVQVATNPAFDGGTMVLDATIAATSIALSGLAPATVYYWRVEVENACGKSGFAPTGTFQTGEPECAFDFESTDVPVVISNINPSVVTSELDVPEARFVADVQVSLKISHTWVGDLVVRLIAPDGTTVVLFDQPGYPALSSGCNGDDLELVFDDNALLTAADLEATCDNMPAISGTFQPVQALANFKNLPANGTWKLEVDDSFPEDGGGITDWGLTFCFLAEVPAAELLVNNPLVLASGSTKTIGPDHLQLDVADPAEGVFILLALPQHGTLLLDGTPLGVGGTFTQTDLLGGTLAYANNDDGTTTDVFLFDAVNTGTGGWIHDAAFDIVVVQNDLAVSAEVTETLLCRDAETAQITVTVAGGTPPLQYSLNGAAPQDTNVFDGLPAGTYTVVVTDDFGFTAETAAVTVDNPDGIDVVATATNDHIAVQATGGTLPYTYSLDGGDAQDEPLFEDLPNGDYTVTVNDANGCTATATVTVYVGPLLTPEVATTPTTCYNGTDGTLTVGTVSGGIAPYQYSLDGVDFQDSNVFTDLPAGQYTVTVLDQVGGTITGTAILSQPPTIEVAVSVVLNTISVAANGGTGPLAYSLDGQTFQIADTFGNLANGNYTVTVRDANGCTITVDAEVAVPPLVVELIFVGEILCAGELVVLSVTADGGVPPYAYNLDGGPYQDNGVFDDVSAGTHEVAVRDAMGTVVVITVTVTEPDPVSGAAFVSARTATIIAEGGVPPYQYSLNGGDLQTDNMFPDLANGDYTVIITDANGCTGTVLFSITYLPLSVAASGTDPSCVGADDGNVLLNVVGGTPPYICTSMVFGTCDLSDLPAGTYTYTITDGLGETVEVTVTLTDPPALLLSALAAGNTITATATGGTGNLQYSLDGATYQDSPVFMDLPNGWYIVTVQDANGCTATSDPVLVDFVGTVSPQQAWGLTVQPNPSVGQFLLTLRQAPSGTLRADVFDTGGRLLFQQKYEPSGPEFVATLDLTGLPSGMYTLRLVSGGQVGAVRLVVE